MIMTISNTSEVDRGLAGAPRDGMVRIPGGTFRMGSDKFYPEEAPVHRVTVDGFWIDQHPVTDAAFRRFVEATGYVTFAEIPPDPAEPDRLSDLRALPVRAVRADPRHCPSRATTSRSSCSAKRATRRASPQPRSRTSASTAPRT